MDLTQTPFFSYGQAEEDSKWPHIQSWIWVAGAHFIPPEMRRQAAVYDMRERGKG